MLLHSIFVLQLSVGIVFLLSAFSKFLEPRQFMRTVAKYEILPAPIASLFALMLVPLEVFLAISFLTGWLIDIALPLAAVTLAVFLMAVGINLNRGRKVRCGCFGNVDEQISSRTVARLSLLVLAVLIQIIFRVASGTATPDVSQLVVSWATFVYLLLSVFLATSFVLLGAWMLNLPELISLARSFRPGHLPEANNTPARQELERNGG
jgi:uncharacterized membrane protein YphA (DoxX/SURF4 family)